MGPVSSGRLEPFLASWECPDRVNTNPGGGKKKILVVLHVSHSLKTGGLEQVILDLIRMGPRCGYTAAAASLAVEGALSAQVGELGARFFFLNKAPGLDWPLVLRLSRLVKEQQVEVLHAHNAEAGLYAGLAGLISRRPVVTTRHGLSFGAGLRNKWVRRITGRLSQRTVAVGRSVYEHALILDRIPSDRMRLIYNGVEASDFQEAASRRDQTRANLGCTSQDQVVITVGRMAGVKNYPLLLEAVASLCRDLPQLKLLMVGDGEERDALSAQARDLGLESRAIFPGVRRDVPDLLAAADLFVLSSKSEGVSKALLEAMAAGLPVAATAVGGNPEVVQDGVTGLLVKPGDRSALEKAMARILSDAQLAADLGRAGARRVEEEFSLGASAMAYRRVYDEVLGCKIGK